FFPEAKKTGPFWCASEGVACQYVPQKRPPEPFQTAQGYVVRGLRLTDKRARSGSPFRLFGTASVGSQSLTGIARLHRLRNNPKLAGVSASSSTCASVARRFAASASALAFCSASNLRRLKPMAEWSPTDQVSQS